jgi:peroxidase
MISHELKFFSYPKARSGEGLICCNRTTRTSRVSHPACKPIIIPRDDPFYSRFNQRCNNFVRNAAGPRYNCNLG